MRSLLFLDLETARFDQSADRVVRLSTQLVTSTGNVTYCRRVLPPAVGLSPPLAIGRKSTAIAKAKTASLDEVLNGFARQLNRADLVIGHDVERSLAAIVSAANHGGHRNLSSKLMPPKFGFDAGRRASICTRQVAAEYLIFVGEPANAEATNLPAIYHRIFGQSVPHPQDPTAAVSACQRLYQFLSDAQQQLNIYFPSDILCFED